MSFQIEERTSLGRSDAGHGILGDIRSARKLASSLEAKWTSLTLDAFECRGKVDAFETQSCSDQLVVVTTKGIGKVECFSSGNWHSSSYRPGTVGLTPSGETSLLRVRPHGAQVQELLHLYIPTRFFAAAQDEYRRVGSSVNKQSLNALAFTDPAVSRIALSLKSAASLGAPDLYAETAAMFLAAHLLSLQSGWAKYAQNMGHLGTLQERRLAHVLEYMSAHYNKPLSVRQLADEAGISPFHFVRVFKESQGITPHRHLVRLRMEAAARMLSDTNMDIVEVAVACGYQSAAHFTAAFRKHFSKPPSLYR